MRVLHLNTYLSPEGGVEAYLRPTLAGLAARGTEVGLFYAAEGARPAGSFDFTAKCLPALQPASGTAQERERLVLDAVANFSPDLIHLHKLEDPRVLEWVGGRWPTVQLVHDHYPFACPGYGKFLIDKKTICTRALGGFCLAAPYLQHCGSRLPWRHVPRFRAARRYQRAASLLRQLLVASHHMKEELILNGLPAEKITVLGLPAPSDLFPEAAPSLRESDPKPLVLAVGRLIPHKGFDFLLSALAGSSVPCRVEIVGEGPEKARLARLAATLPKAIEARCVGPLSRAQLAERYAAARVIALPSLWPEPYGLVGLEAMAFARPVVAFDVGGVKDWLSNAESGYLVAERDTAAMGARLEELLADPAIARRLGVAGRARAEREFSMEAHLARLESIYLGLTGRRELTAVV